MAYFKGIYIRFIVILRDGSDPTNPFNNNDLVGSRIFISTYNQCKYLQFAVNYRIPFLADSLYFIIFGLTYA